MMSRTTTTTTTTTTPAMVASLLLVCATLSRVDAGMGSMGSMGKSGGMGSNYCPDGYTNRDTRHDRAQGRITVVTTHQECADRCTTFAGAQYNGGCKGFQTGMFDGMLLCKSYGGSVRSTDCASWAYPDDPGTASGNLGTVFAATNQLNVGGNCCTRR